MRGLSAVGTGLSDWTAGTKTSCGADIPGATLFDKKKYRKRTTHFSGFTFVLQTAY
jgi:hypothetical protein